MVYADTKFMEIKKKLIFETLQPMGIVDYKTRQLNDYNARLTRDIQKVLRLKHLRRHVQLQEAFVDLKVIPLAMYSQI